MESQDALENDKSFGAVSLFTPLIYLKAFFAPSIIGKLKKLAQENGSHRSEGLMNGLKLAIVMVFDNYADAFVNAPDAFGIAPDHDYSDYFNYTKGRGKSVVRNSVRPNHEISSFVNKAYTLLASVVGTNNWKYLELKEGEIEAFADTLRNIFLDCYVVKDQNGHDVVAETALNIDAIGYWDACYTNIMPILHKYTDHFYEFSSKNIPEYDEVFDDNLQHDETRFDALDLVSDFMPKQIPDSWAVGYSITIQEMFKSLTNNSKVLSEIQNLDSEVIKVENWRGFEQIVRKVDVILKMPKSIKYKYYLKKAPSKESIKGLISEPKFRKSPDRLLSILGNRARLIGSGDSGAAELDFMCLLDGALVRSKTTKEKVRIAVFTHKIGPEEENYSIGLFMPAYGMFSNISRWWMFYYLGNNHPGSAQRNWGEIMNKIETNSTLIDRIDVEAEDKEFLEYCEDPGYRRLNAELKSTNQIVGNLRGVFPELLISNILANKGFSKVKLRQSPFILMGRKNVSGGP